MGSEPSRPTPPSPMLPSPWRKVYWGENRADLEFVKDYRPQHADVTRLRVLLYGPVGAGKSSFINSVSSVLKGRTATPAAAGSEEHSLTKKYTTHKIKKGQGEHYRFVFNDVMGLEEGGGQGVSVADIKLAMMGHVSEGYKFNPVSPLTPRDAGYNACPTEDDKVHVVVGVGSGNSSSMAAVDKMKEIRAAALELGIPQVVVLTKFDEYCPETQKDLQNIYKSKAVKSKMAELSAELGIPLNIILPVKNCCQDTELDQDAITLILKALKLIVDVGDDFLDTL